MQSRINTFYNALRFAIKSPANMRVISNKIIKRFSAKKESRERDTNLNWIKNNCSSYESVAKNINLSLWLESVEYSEVFNKRSQQTLQDSPIALGGGGIYPFLYFITRLTKPEIVLETGVAAGFSSQAFLSAIKKNNTGFLYSSDFPYFRFADSEKYIGILVEEELKQFWELHKAGDEINLPLILKKIKTIDIFHYDSDKTYKGRSFATKLIENKISEKTVLIFDDIQDNSHFHDYVNSRYLKKWYVFEFGGKYIGLIGNLENL